MKKINLLVILLGLLLNSTSNFGQVTTKQPKPTTKAKTTNTTTKSVVSVEKKEIDPIILTIAGEQIPKSEFERVYKKNNKDSVFTEKGINEYLDLYINYKLKVKEAEELKLDTNENFINELSGYRKQLSQPYLTDKNVSEKLIKEAYDRLNKDVKASHVLIKINQDALPKDTIVAYNRIMKIREQILKSGDFAKVARDSSEDPSAKDNGGDLGYFTGMQMVYPFETAAYSTKPGQISMPVRTRFGYHIIKTIDIRPAQGEIHAAHIMVKLPKDANDSIVKSCEAKINEARAALKNGQPWDSVVVRYSEDKGSMKKNGDLPFFGTGRMVMEFEKAAFGLKSDGDISDVVRTSYGWHIIKRIEKRGVPSFDDKKSELKQMINRDGRSETSKSSMVNKIKTDYKFYEFPKTKDEVIAVLDSTLSAGEWKMTKADNLNKPVFSLTDDKGKVTKYTQQDFAGYIASHQTKRTELNPQVIGFSMYDQWITEQCLAYEESKLDEKYPDFRNLMKEYRDGILLFDLTDKTVWSKAVKDTVGLKNFHDQNKNNYLWGERCDAVIYTFSNEEAVSDFKKMIKKGKKTPEQIISDINSKTKNSVASRSGRYAHAENDIIEQAGWKVGLNEKTISHLNQLHLVEIKTIFPPMPKTLDETKGVITADYQSHLEKEWIQSLREKYPIKINNEVIQTLWKK